VSQLPSGDFFEETAEQEQEEPEPQESLDAARIQRVMSEHRSLHRLRLWCKAGVALMAVLAVMSAVRVVEIQSSGSSRWWVFVVVMVLCVSGARRLWRKSGQLARELDGMKLPEPATKPSFDDLGDGRRRFDGLG
jgi:hypothetical protein